MEGVCLSLGHFPAATGFQGMVTQDIWPEAWLEQELWKQSSFPCKCVPPFQVPKELFVHHDLGLQLLRNWACDCILNLPVKLFLHFPTWYAFTFLLLQPAPVPLSYWLLISFSVVSLAVCRNCPPGPSMIRYVLKTVLILITMTWDPINSGAEVSKLWSVKHLGGWLNIQVQGPHPRSSECKSQAPCICVFNTLPRHYRRAQSLGVTVPYYLICLRKQNCCNSSLDLYSSCSCFARSFLTPSPYLSSCLF